jgi:hypothetical protein
MRRDILFSSKLKNIKPSYLSWNLINTHTHIPYPKKKKIICMFTISL